MTLTHHPSEALLLDYAAGSLGEAPSLAMAAHLTLCPRCRRDNRRLEIVGGNFMAEALETARAPADPLNATFDAIITRVAQARPETRPPHPAHAILPSPLRAALGCDVDSVPWRRLGMGAYHYVIPTRDTTATARLLRIPAGRPVPEHTHSGFELTLTLCGAYADATGAYARGDLQEADGTLVHQPHAAPSEECICLAVTGAPLRFKSWAARLVQPFLAI
jgi:putative transcriptional regulator